MTKEERDQRLYEIPKTVRDFLLSLDFADKTIELYKQNSLDTATCQKVSTLILDIILGENSISVQKEVTALINNTDAANKIITFIQKEVQQKVAILKNQPATTTPQSPSPTTLKGPSGIDHDINTEWYNKERDEILREIEGPQQKTTIAAPTTPTRSTVPLAPITQKTPTAFSAALTGQKQPSATTPKPPLAVPKVAPGIFSLPRTTTEVKAGNSNSPTATQAGTVGNKPADPYREPPVA